MRTQSNGVGIEGRIELTCGRPRKSALVDPVKVDHKQIGGLDGAAERSMGPAHYALTGKRDLSAIRRDRWGCLQGTGARQPADVTAVPIHHEQVAAVSIGADEEAAGLRE
jgi:hypothetical protein